MIPGLGTITGGAGGLSASASATATSGDAKGTSGTGVKHINFGSGNPNTATGLFSNPLVILGIVVVIYVIATKSKKR